MIPHPCICIARALDHHQPVMAVRKARGGVVHLHGWLVLDRHTVLGLSLGFTVVSAAAVTALEWR